MLAQWISWAYRDGYQRARREPLITLGSAPLDGQGDKAAHLPERRFALGEPGLDTTSVD